MIVYLSKTGVYEPNAMHNNSSNSIQARTPYGDFVADLAMPPAAAKRSPIFGRSSNSGVCLHRSIFCLLIQSLDFSANRTMSHTHTVAPKGCSFVSNNTIIEHRRLLSTKTKIINLQAHCLIRFVAPH